MSNTLRRVTAASAAVAALLAGSTGAAAAEVSTRQTLTSCFTNTAPIYSAKVCVNVEATNVGSGKWHIHGITGTVSERKFQGAGGGIYFRLSVFNPKTRALAFTNEDRFKEITDEPTITYRFDLAGLDTSPRPLPQDFWTRFSGNVFIKFEFFHPGFYSRKDLGTPAQTLS